MLFYDAVALYGEISCVALIKYWCYIAALLQLNSTQALETFANSFINTSFICWYCIITM